MRRQSTEAFSQADEAGEFKTKGLERYIVLWPCILGLTLSRVGVVVSSYGSYASTDAGIYTDVSTLFTIATMGLVLIFIVVQKKVFSRTFVHRLGIVSILVEALSLLLMALESFLDLQNDVLHLTLSVLAMISVSGAIYYWLRKARGASPLTATVLVFSSVLLSEILIYPFAVIPEAVGYCLAGILTVGQLFCIKWCRSRMRAFTLEEVTSTSGYFSLARNMRTNAQLLIMTAISIGCLSLISGFLRGYPDGSPIAFTPPTRILYSLITIAICIAIIALVARGDQWIMTTGIWVIMQVTAYLALLAYAIFPNELQYGAVFATVLNVVILACNWYMTIAFMSYGHRDPLFYALGGWIVWFGGRAFGRIIVLNFYPASSNDLIMTTLIAGMLLFSAQVTFLQFVSIVRRERKSSDQTSKSPERQSTMERLMGFDDNKSFTDLRQAAMAESAREVSKQFLLSERETEVLVLYALGFTQKRVAEELYITAGTVHGHVKRIYMKTGLHSRQQILDYMEKYTS